MRHGIVMSGRTTTLYGDYANTWLAQQSALHCDTIERAEEMILNSGGHYRDVLIVNLRGKFLLDKDGKRRKFKISKKLGKAMEEADARAAELEQKRFNYNRMYAMRTNKVRTIKRESKTSCVGCDKTIKAGEEFYQCTYQHQTYRAHKGCADKAQFPK